jgi:hypothetical protein
MNNKINDNLNTLLQEQKMFLNYLKAKFPVFHNSNFFYRDLEYGIKGYFEKKGNLLNNRVLGEIAIKFSEHLEQERIFIKTSSQAWKINYPEFITTVPGDPL